MPVRGMSSPISLSGVLAQTTAECLACAAVVAALDLAGGVTYRTDAFSSYAIDMRSTKVLVSGPDYLQLMVLSIFLARRYGIAAPMGKALMTASKCPDEQAAAEKATQALAAALAGAGTFTAAGTLSGVEVFSPVQMVIDHEIMSWVDACVRPLGFCDNDFALDEIDTVGPNGTFMDSPSTVRCFREVFWRPNIFSFSPFPAWLGEGRPMLAEKAHDKLRSMTLPDEPIIPKEQQRELRKIEERFASRLS
jgi:trimethylamine--corrinoid protein Co-methyltransferase